MERAMTLTWQELDDRAEEMKMLYPTGGIVRP
jgi:hypothetical protein